MKPISLAPSPLVAQMLSDADMSAHGLIILLLPLMFYCALEFEIHQN